jgi:hypothetical protein
MMVDIYKCFILAVLKSNYFLGQKKLFNRFGSVHNVTIQPLNSVLHLQQNETILD